MTRHYSNINIFMGVVLLLFLSNGCAAVHMHWPGKAQIKNSAVRSFRHPGTWIPAAGAAVIALGNWDDNISDWAREETPVFGSQHSAQNNSDRFRSYAHYGMVLSALAVRDDSESYWGPAVERLVFEHVGVIAATTTRIPIKKITDRDRPNGGTEGFPSGHSTRAFAYTGMTYRNIDNLNLTPLWKYSAKSVETLFAYSTAWARVEAGYHYPTDVLAGGALGNFVTLFLYDAFFEEADNIHIAFSADKKITLSFKYNFK